MDLHHRTNCEAQAETDLSKCMMEQLGNIGTYTRIVGFCVFKMSFELPIDRCQCGYRVEGMDQEQESKRRDAEETRSEELKPEDQERLKIRRQSVRRTITQKSRLRDTGHREREPNRPLEIHQRSQERRKRELDLARS